MMKRILSRMLLLCLPLAGHLHAQVLQKGQAIFTFNYGQKVAEIIDVRNNGLACPGVNWHAPMCANTAAITQPSNWSFARMKSIFGIAIDKKADVFFAASPILGTVSDTGIIFRADNANLNSVSDFIVNTNTYGPVVGTNKIPNNRRGFGNIAYDEAHNQLFATNLLDGKIYRIKGVATASGTVASVFSPPFNNFSGNINQPVTAGSLLWGIGVNRDNDGVIRVYFARQMASPALSEIWSVELDAAGEFVASTAIYEFDGPTDAKITDLAFPPGDHLLLGERRAAGDHNSKVWEYRGTHLAWLAEATKVEVGDYSTHENCAGGVDYGYRQAKNDTTSLGDCAQLIWASSDAIHFPKPYIYGICATPTDGYVGTFLQNAFLVDFDTDTTTVPKGWLGDVEVFRDPCPIRDICSYLDVSAKPVDDPAAGGCCYVFTLNNQYLDDYFTGVQFCGLDGVQLSYSGVLPTWDVVQHNPTTVTIEPHGSDIPVDHFINIVQLCLSGGSGNPQQVVVKWLGPDPNRTAVCTDTLTFDCGGNTTPHCVRAINDTLVCKGGKYVYTFQIKNNAPFNVQSFVITPLDTTIQVSPALTNLPSPGIPTGSTSGVFSVNLTGSGLTPGNTFCFYLTAHDVPITGNGNMPHECCTDSVLVDCLPIPACDPCDGVAVIAKPIGPSGAPGSCCFSLSVSNQYYPGYFTGVQVAGLGGVQVSYASGWAIQPPVLPSSVTFIPPGGTLDTGTIGSFAQICLNGFSTPVQQFVVNLLGPDSSVVCSDTIKSDCPPPPPPTCATAVNDSLWCDGGQVKYTFSIKNAPTNTFNIASFNLLLADTAGFQVTQTYFIPGSPIPPGGTGGPYTIDVWGSAVQAGNPFCFILTAHDGVWGGDPADFPRTCCTDSVNVRCLTVPNCSSPDSCCCCAPSGIQIPTGLSSNGDNLNDLFVVKGIAKCKHATLTVFNRWGNIVFQQDDYDNTWAGTNQSGQDLPQGTYFVLITLHDTGSMVSGYVDLRRL